MFNIKDDLRGRSLSEILWISGPTWHDAEQIAARLAIPVDQVRELLNRPEPYKGGKHGNQAS